MKKFINKVTKTTTIATLEDIPFEPCKKIFLQSRNEIETAIKAGATVYKEEIETDKGIHRILFYIIVPLDKLVQIAQ